MADQRELLREKDAEIERLRRACEFHSTPPAEHALAQIKEAKPVAWLAQWRLDVGLDCKELVYDKRALDHIEAEIRWTRLVAADSSSEGANPQLASVEERRGSVQDGIAASQPPDVSK
jgi:hypothetical protein